MTHTESGRGSRTGSSWPRTLLAATCTIATLSGLATLGCRRDDPPHVVWIVIDALRADRLGTYGYAPDTSPVLDGLADRGIVFERAMSQESYTQASVPSYFTSTYPLTNRRDLRAIRRVDVLD